MRGTADRPLDVVVHDRSLLLTDCLVAAFTRAGLTAASSTEAERAPAVLLLDPQAHGASDVSARLAATQTRILLLGAPPSSAAEVVGRDQPVAVVVQAVRRALTGRAARPAPPSTGALTRREQQVLTLVSRGARNDDVSATLGISSHTVRTHVQNVLAKLEQPSRHAAVAYAHRHGLLDDVASSP